MTIDIDEDVIPTQREVVGLLAQFVKAREVEQIAKAEKERHGGKIKRYLEAYPEERVTDGEHGLYAELSYRNLPLVWDCAAMPEQTVLELAAIGALTVDNKVAEALAGKFGVFLDAKPFSHPGAAVASLQVRRSRS